MASASSVNDEDTAALFPPCASPETTLMEQMFPPPTVVPGGFSLMDEVVHRIRRGELSLSPSRYRIPISSLLLDLVNLLFRLLAVSPARRLPCPRF